VVVIVWYIAESGVKTPKIKINRYIVVFSLIGGGNRVTRIENHRSAARFDELPTHRLCKIVFTELIESECVEWKCVNYMKNIFQSIGLDHFGNC
jgi:hypothetical protein